MKWVDEWVGVVDAVGKVEVCESVCAVENPNADTEIGGFLPLASRPKS
jgi:hypothetical protein